MIAQPDALLRLLHDDDAPTLALIKGELARTGSSALPELRALLATAEPVAARHLRDVIAEIEALAAEAEFGALCAGFAPDGDLEEAAWCLGRVFFPGENFTGQRALLDAWGAEVARRLTKAENETDRIETLVEFLAEDAGLRGNTEDFHNLNNSLLPEVIETRLGIPISLSLVYLLVGRRAGMPLSGVGLPGHFLVRYGQNFFDPFHEGMRVGLDECRVRLAQQGLALTASSLQPVAPRPFLIRMLTNILLIAEKSDPPLAAKLEEWIGALQAGGTA